MQVHRSVSRPAAAPAAGGRPVTAVRQLTTRLRSDGLAATARAVGRLLADQCWLRESHVWLLMPLHGSRPRPELPRQLTSARVAATQISIVARLGISVSSSMQRLERGHQLFAVFDGERPIGVMWAFLGEAPTVASASGWLPLPPGYVNVEDTVVAPDQRGLGIAPALYSRVFDDVMAQGYTHVVGKIPVSNTANRRACAKTGWTEFATVDLLKVLRWRRVAVRPVSNPDVEWLARVAQLHSRAVAASSQ